MNMSRFGLSAGVAFLLAAPALAQSAEPPAGSPPAGTESQTTQPQAPDSTAPAPSSADHSGHQNGNGKSAGKTNDKDMAKDGTQAPKPE